MQATKDANDSDSGYERAISSAFTAYAPPRFRRATSLKYKNIYTAVFFVAPAVVATRSAVPDLWGLASTHWCCAGALHLNAHEIKAATF
jgi:hypothetical protein